MTLDSIRNSCDVFYTIFLDKSFHQSPQQVFKYLYKIPWRSISISHAKLLIITCNFTLLQLDFCFQRDRLRGGETSSEWLHDIQTLLLWYIPHKLWNCATDSINMIWYMTSNVEHHLYMNDITWWTTLYIDPKYHHNVVRAAIVIQLIFCSANMIKHI